MKRKLSYFIYRFIKSMVRFFYPKTTVSGVENLPAEACVIVGNHAQMHGPIVCEICFPVERYTWCAAEMMHLAEVPAYAFKDFWSEKPLYSRWFYKILSFLIAPLSVCVFNNANTIGVHKNKKIIVTFRETVRRLSAGSSIVIFPEHGIERNEIVNEFQTGFTDIARLYYRKTGKRLKFVPMYVAPSLKKFYFGKPTCYCPDAECDEMERIRTYLMDEITSMAKSVERHRVVPYRNVSKKEYPYSKKTGE